MFAVDARSGKELWRWDPHVPREFGQKACCDVVNRGVAIYKGRIYASVLDGRLAALDAATGKLIWEVLTVDQNKPYTITGAPRVVEGKVIIGNGGAEYGVRGYVSAYDAETSKQAWRTYIVPGDPSQPFESEAMRKAAATWKGGKWWEVGGGGTAWDAMVYDSDLRLLYIGTGNGSPWVRSLRSPGGGDNLYLSSILALNPDTGELVWHYQTTPGDNWDYTATQPLMLAELPISGEKRKVIMQAPKNGFFYVLDRQTGKLISAEPFVEVTWATGVDKQTGRPIENQKLDYRKEAKTIKPSPLGAHSWHPMSYNPATGLVYIPTQDIPWVFQMDNKWEYRPGAWNLGSDLQGGEGEIGLPRDSVSGHLLAWDPVKQKEVWRAQYALPWNGGTLTTAGNLVFQGASDGRFIAYQADNGKKLWEFPVGTGIMAAPVTYLVDGQQYVSVLAGWGGAFALVAGDAALAAKANNSGRLLTFKLGGTATLPQYQIADRTPTPISATASAEDVQRGKRLYHQWCAGCHGAGAISGGVLPDLRYMTETTHQLLPQIILDGLFLGKGMPNLSQWLTKQDVEFIRGYLLKRAEQLKTTSAKPEK